MRKIMTMLVGVIFLATAMAIAMGCATSNSIKALDHKLQKITNTVDEHEQFIQTDFDKKLTETDAKIAVLQETDEVVLARLDEINGGIDQIKASLGLETTIATAAAKEVETPSERKRVPTKKVTIKPEIAKVKVPKITETLEYRLAKLTERVDSHKARLNGHDGQISNLRRQLAQFEDEIKPVYLWTQPFPSGKPKKPKEKEKPQLPIEFQPGLDDLAIEILAGRVKLEKEVCGHADPIGKEEDNLDLSKRRAQSCIDYLVSKLGPDKEVIWKTDTEWKDYFVAVGKGEMDRYGNFEFNRRVRFEKKK